MSYSILNAVKIQSRVVIPIIRELEKEIGKERAHAVIGRAIANAYVDYRELKGFEENSHPLRHRFLHARRVPNNHESVRHLPYARYRFSSISTSVCRFSFSTFVVGIYSGLRAKRSFGSNNDDWRSGPRSCC